MIAVTMGCDFGHRPMWREKLGCKDERTELKRRVKFVAAVLIATLIAVPVSAAGHCLAMGASVASQCTPACPMMKSHPRELGSSSIAAGTDSCCQISSMPPRAKETAASPRTQISSAFAQAAYFAFEAATSGTRTGSTSEDQPPPGSSSQQSLFCTFLI